MVLQAHLELKGILVHLGLKVHWVLKELLVHPVALGLKVQLAVWEYPVPPVW